MANHLLKQKALSLGLDQQPVAKTAPLLANGETRSPLRSALNLQGRAFEKHRLPNPESHRHSEAEFLERMAADRPSLTPVIYRRKGFRSVRLPVRLPPEKPRDSWADPVVPRAGLRPVLQRQTETKPGAR